MEAAACTWKRLRATHTMVAAGDLGMAREPWKGHTFEAHGRSVSPRERRSRLAAPLTKRENSPAPM